MRQEGRGSRRVAVAAVVVGPVLICAAVVTGVRLLPAPLDAGTVPPVAAAPAASGTAPGATAPGAAGAPAGAGAPAVAAPGAAVGPPVRLRFPAVAVDAPVTPVDVGADGVLGVPDDVHVLGWWGAPAGATSGTTVIDGHVDSLAHGAGALFHLADSPVGATVILTTPEGGQRHYTVTARRSYRKSALPADLFATSGQPRLVLVTCGGAFDRASHHYDSNTVVYAVPAPLT